MHFLFETSAFNELDHFTPVATQLLEDGHKVTYVMGDDSRLGLDSRVSFLKSFSHFEHVDHAALLNGRREQIFRLLSRLWFGRLLRGLLPNHVRLSLLVLSSRFSGVFKDASHLEFDCGISGWGDPTSFLMTATLARRKPIVSLPHGYPCIKNEAFNREVRRIRAATGSLPDFSIRNSFRAYVVATERNKLMLQNWNVSANVIEVWGNARFSPRWVRRLVEIVPPVNTDALPSIAHRVLFLLPAPTSTFEGPDLVSLLDRLTELPILLILKPHTRNNTYREVIPSSLLRKPNVVDLRDADTIRLVEMAETVINFATGAALDAIHLNKRLIFTKYLSTNSYSWEDCTGIRIAESEDQCLKFVLDRSWSTDQAAVQPYVSQEVFVNGRISDPISNYATRLCEIAATGVKR